MKRSTDRILTTCGQPVAARGPVALNRARAKGRAPTMPPMRSASPPPWLGWCASSASSASTFPTTASSASPWPNYDYGVWWNYAFARMAGFVPWSRFPVPAQEVERRGARLDDDRQAPRLAEVQRIPTRTRIERHAARQRRPPADAAPGLHRADQICRPRHDRGRHREPEKGHGGCRRSRKASCARSDRELRSRRGPPPQNEEEFVFAAADAMREEYKAIVDAGIVLQIDDPSLPDNWDMVDPEPPLQEFKKFAGAHRGVESPRCAACRRMHPLPHLLGKLARPAHHRHSVAGHRRPGAERQCRRLLGGGGNVRHEHEWRVWQDVALPTASCSFPASSATQPTSWSIPRWSPTGSCDTGG